MISLQKKSIEYPKQLEIRIRELEEKLLKANKSIEILLSIFKVEMSSFYFTGKFKKGKDFWKKRVGELGGFICGNPTYYTSYCICNEFTNKVSRKCRDDMGIICITEEQLEWLLDNM
jgi:hypothetical protein